MSGMQHIRRAWMPIVVCLVVGGVSGECPVAAASQGVAQSKRASTSLTFNGTEFFHRWSRAGQHEFTPAGDEDLEAWKEMVTVNVHDPVRTGEALAGLANRVLGNYKAHGQIMRTSSKPRTAATEAEHFIAAQLQAPMVLEVAFARVLLFEGHGIVAVYSKRFYGTDAPSEMTRWSKANAVPIENALVNWTGIPALTVLNSLPESPQ